MAGWWRAYSADDGDKSLKHFVRQQPASRREPDDLALPFEQAGFYKLPDAGEEWTDPFLAELGCDFLQVHTLVQAQPQEKCLFDRRRMRDRCPNERLGGEIAVERIRGREADRFGFIGPAAKARRLASRDGTAHQTLGRTRTGFSPPGFQH